VKIRTRKLKTKTVLTLTGDLTFDHVGTVLTAVQKHATTAELEIALSELGELDVAGLQLLYAVQGDRAGADRSVTFTGEAALERLQRMAEFAGLPSVEQG
jgi:ABC-type transporter Mla MlaB component